MPQKYFEYILMARNLLQDLNTDKDLLSSLFLNIISMRLPSFLASTLSLAFMACVVTVIDMTLNGIEPNEKLLAVLVSIISAYLASRNPNQVAKDEKENKI